MSAFRNSQMWEVSNQNLSSKYEKCLNITEEIYKRINITFQIKKLETGSQSDISEHSDQIDSNDLSNETDLFACDKTDSLPSSEPEAKAAAPTHNNNNICNLKKTVVAVLKRPKKRFRKRVKKRSSVRGDSDASSDEDAPSAHQAVPAYVALAKDVKPKILSTDKGTPKVNVKNDAKEMNRTEKDKTDKEAVEVKEVTDSVGQDLYSGKCSVCSTSFKAERALRRHMVVSHRVQDIPNVDHKAKPA